MKVLARPTYNAEQLCGQMKEKYSVQTLQQNFRWFE